MRKYFVSEQRNGISFFQLRLARYGEFRMPRGDDHREQSWSKIHFLVMSKNYAQRKFFKIRNLWSQHWLTWCPRIAGLFTSYCVFLFFPSLFSSIFLSIKQNIWPKLQTKSVGIKPIDKLWNIDLVLLLFQHILIPPPPKKKSSTFYCPFFSTKLNKAFSCTKFN